MKWNHLPVAGGIYAQHPRLIDDFAIIFAAVHKKERQDAEKAKQPNRTRSKG